MMPTTSGKDSQPFMGKFEPTKGIRQEVAFIPWSPTLAAGARILPPPSAASPMGDP